MRRRLLAALACLPMMSAWAQPAGAGRRKVGFLHVGTKEEFLDGERELLLRALAERGYVAGNNLELVERYGARDAEALYADARDIVAAGVDAIVTEGTPATLAARKATHTIPIVTNVGDPVGAGFARSLAAPGANVTGLSQNRSALASKQVEILRELVPGLQDIAVIYMDVPGAQAFVQPVAAAARAASLRTQTIVVNEGAASTAIAECARLRLRAAITFTWDDALGPAALQHRVAVVVSSERAIGTGAVASIENDGRGDGREMAGMLDRVLRGTPAGAIPFRVATTYRMVVDSRAVTALRLKAPQALLLRADRVI